LLAVCTLVSATQITGEAMVFGSSSQEPGSGDNWVRSRARRSWKWMKDTFTSAPVTAQLQSLDGRTQVQTTAIETVGQQIADLSRNQRGMLQVLEQNQAMFGRIDSLLVRLASLNEAVVKDHEDTARMLTDVRAQLDELRSMPADLAAAKAELASGFREAESRLLDEASRTREQLGALTTGEQLQTMLGEGVLAQGLASTRAQIVNELQKVQQVLAMHGVDVRDRIAALPSLERIRALLEAASPAGELEGIKAWLTTGLQDVSTSVAERVAGLDARIAVLPSVDHVQAAVDTGAVAQQLALEKGQVAESLQKIHEALGRQSSDVLLRLASLPSTEQVQSLINNGTIATELASAWSQLVDGLQRVQETVAAHAARMHEQLATLPSADHIQGLVNGGALVQEVAKTRSDIAGGLQKVSYETSAQLDGVQSRLAAIPTGDEFRALIGSGTIIQEVAAAKAHLSEGLHKVQAVMAEQGAGVQARLAQLPSTEQVHAFIEGGTASTVQSTRKLVAEEAQRGQLVAERTASRLSALQSRGVIPLPSMGLVMCRNPLGYVAVPADDLATVGSLADGLLPRQGTLKFIEKHLKPGGTFVDVGANVGLFSLLAARVAGPGGKVIAIEPAPVAAAALRATVSANGLEALVQVEEVAAGAERGLGTLSVTSNCRLSTLLSAVLPPGVSASTVVTEVVTLDEILGDIVPDVVKISVGGWELKVLDGMQGLLAAHPDVILVMEFDPAHIRSTGLSAAGWVDRMGSAGMRISEIDERNGELLPLRRSGIEEIVSTNVVISRNPALRREGVDEPLWQTA
jgi:FkbM family methyltransferase